MPDIERSGTGARLLALLTSTPGQEFHTRELIRRIHGSPRPVQPALEKLLRQGLVESRRVGPLRAGNNGLRAQVEGTEAPDVRPGLDRFWSQPRIHGPIRVGPTGRERGQRA